MVDLRLEGVNFDANALAMKDTYVALRVGESQKLSRLSQTRDFKFPKNVVGDRKFGKVDVFRRVGTASISIKYDPNTEFEEVDVPCRDGSKMKFRVALSGKDTQDKAPSKEMGGAVAEAKTYLSEHNLEMRLAEAMQAVLRDRPPNPANFIADKLKESEGVNRKVVSRPNASLNTSPKAETNKGEDVKAELRANLGKMDARMEGLRMTVQTSLSGAVANGTLQKAINQVMNNAILPSVEPVENAKEELRANILNMDARMEDLRVTFKKSLLDAVANGALQKAIDAQLPSADLDGAKGELKGNLLNIERKTAELKETIKTALVDACSNGTFPATEGLEAAKEEVKGNLLKMETRTAKLKGTVKTALADAFANGTLQKVVEEQSLLLANIGDQKIASDAQLSQQVQNGKMGVPSFYRPSSQVLASRLRPRTFN